MRITLDLPPGLNSDDTVFAAAPAWADGSNCRPRLGRMQTIGGFESLTTSTLTGVCRSVFCWTDNDATLNLAFGTHSALQLYQGGMLYTITPFGPVTVLGADPLTSANGSGLVTVAHEGHGLATGNEVIVSGASTFNGLDAANLNGTRTITVTSANAYTFVAGAGDTASAPGAGGGSAVRVVPQVLLPEGAIDGAGSSGYGTGAYGLGPYGAPSTNIYYPRTWSLAAWGQKLLASPRGGSLYEWANDTAARAVAVANAPPNITSMGVSPQFQVFAFGTNEEASGDFNPMCIRHSATRDHTTWSTATTTVTTAREYVLPGGGRIVGHRFIGKYCLVWTNHQLFLGTYVGQVTQVWKFERVGDKCGLIGPNAVVILGSTAYWISPDRQFHSYSLGGSVQSIACPIREDFAENLAASQGDKIIASTIAEHGEVWWDYPDSRDGLENSRYIALQVQGPDAGAWFRGVQARTARVDAGPSAYPCAVTYGGAIYWHEKGHSADGGVLSWRLRSAGIILDENSTLMVRQCWPDIADQLGPVTLTIYARAYPQGESTMFGPYSMTPDQEKVDLRISGRLFEVELAGAAAPSSARLGRLVFDVKPRGRR